MSELCSNFTNTTNYTQEVVMELLTQREVSKMINMSEAWLEQKRCKGGGIPFIKIGRSVKYDRKDVEEFIEKHKRRNTSQ
jgi:predicted DNA-binding transcriptional regulator AlpA